MPKKLKYTSPGTALRKIKIGLKKLYRSTASPHQIALGFAVGAFIGIFPTFGLGLLLCAGLGALFKFNIPASLLGSLVGMPWITPFWVSSSIALGRLIHPGDEKMIRLGEGFQSFFQDALGMGADYLLGNLIISVVISGILYFLVRFGVKSYRESKTKKKSESPA